MITTEKTTESQITEDAIVSRTIRRLQVILGPSATLTRRSELTITGPGCTALSVLWTAELCKNGVVALQRRGNSAPEAARKLAEAASYSGMFVAPAAERERVLDLEGGVAAFDLAHLDEAFAAVSDADLDAAWDELEMRERPAAFEYGEGDSYGTRG